jgi:ATP-binding cassette subfamily B protein
VLRTDHIPVQDWSVFLADLQGLMTATQRMLRYLSHHKPRLVAGVASILAVNIAKVASPAILQRAIDSVIATPASSHVLKYGGFIVAAVTVQGIFVFLHRQLVLGVSRDIERDLRNDCYGHLQGLAFLDIQTGSIGDLTARVTNDVSKAIMGAGQAFIYLLNTVFTLVIVLIAMALLSWKLTIAVLIPLLFTAAIVWKLDKSIKAKAEKVQALFGRIFNHVQETLSAVRTVRAYLQDQAKLESFQQLNQQYAVEGLKLRRLSVLLPPLLQFLMGISFVALLWYGGRLAMAGTLSVGKYVQFTVYLGYLSWPIAESGWTITVLQQGMASMQRVHSMLSREPSIKDRPCAVESAKLSGSIEFRNLNFQYPQSSQPALYGITLKIDSGRTVALVGPIGSGKSTLMNMIPRLLDSNPGQLLMDGRCIHEIPLSVLRASLGYVPQETFLFSDTIAFNIAFGLDAASPEQIEQAAAEAAIADEITAFPAGYQTLLGERGITLSGGQRQRIGIARALIRDARVLLLDDAFSSVDAFTEANILRHFQNFMIGRTCIVSSHRISAIKDADWIVVLRQGQIAEQGTHCELLSREGLYAEMHEKQLLEEQLNTSS